MDQWGPLYGMLFDEMAQACEDEEEITADVFAEMITASVEGIQDISPAQVGDKSLLDTLIPAKEAFVEAKEAGKDFAECLDAMNAAAEKGWQSTKDLVAKIDEQAALENVPEEFLMQEQLAVILSSQLLEAQQRACYKNDLYCESNEPSIYSYNLFRRTSKFRERSFEVFHFIGNFLDIFKKVIDK